MANQEFLYELSANRRAICDAYRFDETLCIEKLLEQAEIAAASLKIVQDTARKLVVDVRRRRLGKGGLDAFLFEYDLSTEEGVALMCLAEALLRIPDNFTVDKLIHDKITSPDWEKHIGKSHSTFVNAATWALMLTGNVLTPERSNAYNLTTVLRRLAQSGGEPIIRKAIVQAMKILGDQFVTGETIEEAIQRSKSLELKGYMYSYDMLGEEARTAKDAERYYVSYEHAISVIGAAVAGRTPYTAPGISVKLSALHPRFEWSQRSRVLNELLPKIKQLALAAKEANIGFTIDAEEAERLDLSLDIIEHLIADESLNDWQGLGLAVQAYQKRAPFVIDYICVLAKKHGKRIMLRLVKGAYWDSEIKWSQEKGLGGYPVFTRKDSTDVSYIACVKKILAATEVLYPQFATHNAYTVAVILELAGEYRDFEFQCLHGMGDTLYDSIVGNQQYNIPCRIYAPVGIHRDLLPYLVRRLLENGANTSFVNRIVDEGAPIEELIADPCRKVQELTFKPHSKIPLPENIYGDARPNARGIDFTNQLEYRDILEDFNKLALDKNFQTAPSFNKEQVLQALDKAETAAFTWANSDPQTRIYYLQCMADLLDQNKVDLMYLIIKEGHRTILDAMSELREAIDFCWYYSHRAGIDFKHQILTSVTGEIDQFTLHGRGIVACISPWNFPLAIFLGQVAAALLAGNTVLAKPAGQTPTIAAKVVELLHLAGVPKDVVQVVPGSGSEVGEVLINDTRVKAIMFTGSTETARHINQVLANREGAIIPFIAETGGQNVMIVDSSALPEQVIKDVILSAFGSAGQRCSSLRVLYLQDDIADHMIEMLVGAMAEIMIGDPIELATDIGPIIDAKALDPLCTHRDLMKKEAKLLYEVEMPDGLQGNYFAPCAFEIKCISQLAGEVFGPILHVVRYKSTSLQDVLNKINATGFGLTLGIHSRVNETVEFIVERVRVGNIYVNRNMIGAVVGVQPFGGEGLSGTGPKAGGPHYLPRLANERSLSINTAAAGGNATLMCLEE